jgi:phosphate transport system substrate-binding protein
MLKNQDAPVLALAALLITIAPALSAGFTLPETVPKGTTLRIDGANSLPHLNQALKTGFQTKFPGTTIATTENTTGAALQAVLEGRADVVAIARPLTATEKSQGLLSMPIAQPLSYVYRGPNPNLAVQGFLGYVKAPATQSVITRAVRQDIATLKGVSSAIAPNKEIEMGNVKVSAPSATANGNKTPSAPLKPGLDSTNAIAPVQKPGFPWLLWFLPLLGIPLLGWWLLGLWERGDRSVADPLLDDRTAAMPEVPQVEGPPPMASGPIALGPVAPNPMAMTPVLSHPPIHYAGQANPGEHSSNVRAGGLDANAREAAPNGCRLVIMPRVPKRAVMGAPQTNEPRAYVYWDLPMEARQTAKAQGGQQLVLRVYDATNIDLDHQAAHSFRQYPIADDDRDRVFSVPQGDRDYVAEMGYLTAEGRMLLLVRSTYAHVPMKDAVNL